MKPYCKISILIIFSIFSIAVAAQTPTKVYSKEYMEAMEKAEKAAKEKAEEEAKAKAKEKESLRKLMEQQAKAEGSQAKLSESTAAAVNAKAEAFYTTAMNQINSKHVAWIKQNAKKIYVDKMDDLAFKVMARYYGKNEGLSEQDIEGLQVLLLREAYLLGKKEYNNLLSKTPIDDNKKISNHASERSPDSSQLRTAEKPETKKGDARDSETKKMAENTNASRAMNSSQIKSEEKNNEASIAKDEQTLRMQEIAQRQQKITQMLSKMVNQVAEHQDSIIKNLK